MSRSAVARRLSTLLGRRTPALPNRICRCITGTQVEDPVPLFLRALRYPDRTAISDQYGKFTYGDLFTRAGVLSAKIKEALGPESQQERVAYLCTSDVTYVTSQWAVWMAGHVGVPLSPMHPPSLLEYMLTDSESKLLLFSDSLSEMVTPLLKSTRNPPQAIPVRPDDAYCAIPHSASDWVQDPDYYWRNLGLILYTSGTTGKPKGAMLTHRNLYSMVHNLVTAWGFTQDDNCLHVLPLNHMHGIVNALMVPLQVGARCTMLPKFDAHATWGHLLSLKASTKDQITVFTAVPTIYSLLIKDYKERFSHKSRAQDYVKAVCQQKLRLMMCGSASLPTSDFYKWAEVSGHQLLERFGMTEIGMALSSPLHGERKPGYVGNPLPTVQVRIGVSEGLKSDKVYTTLAEGTFFGTKVTPGQEGKPGELLVHGPSVFKGYWKKPQETADTFAVDGWFKTGDTAVYQNGSYKILGRTSVDIIKTGGFKVSALEVESVLLNHSVVEECAVIGQPDPIWGNKVMALVVLKPNEKFTKDEMKAWAAKELPPYAVPTEMKQVDELPRNALGKVNKKELQSMFTT